MLRPLALLVIPVSFLAASPLAPQTHPAALAQRTNPALEQFKSLAGEWEGKDSRGTVMHLSYEVLASGVVMERLQPEGKRNMVMVTMYSLDRDHIVAIHFCSAGNQPVLVTGPISAATGKYDFQVERTYGMSSPDDLHMVELVVTLADNDHLSQAWTSLSHGKRSTNTLTFARGK